MELLKEWKNENSEYSLSPQSHGVMEPKKSSMTNYVSKYMNMHLTNSI